MTKSNSITRGAVFLDRDGVLNRAIVKDGKPFPPWTLGDFEILPGVPEALWRLREAGFQLVVVTNQPDVARGVQQRSEVEAMHRELTSRLPVHAVKVCYHDDSDGCACRKPKPGMLLESAAELELDIRASYMIGDRWRDIDAGRAAGCHTVLIDNGYSEDHGCAPDWVTTDLPAAADWILKSLS